MMNGYFVNMETPSDPGAGNTSLLAAGCKNISGPTYNSGIRLTFTWMSGQDRLNLIKFSVFHMLFVLLQCFFRLKNYKKTPSEPQSQM